MDNQSYTCLGKEDREMKYCKYCGKELADNAEICMGCGCQTEQATQQSTKARGKGLSKKSLLLIIISVIAVIGLIVGAKVLKDQRKKQQVIQQLVGETFTYEEYNYYSYNIKRLTFIDEDSADYYYLYSSIDASQEYTRDYKVEIDGDDVYVVHFIDRFKVIFDANGNVEALYDEVLNEEYEKD